MSSATCSGPQGYFMTSFLFSNLISQQNQRLLKWSGVQTHTCELAYSGHLSLVAVKKDPVSFSLISWAIFLHCSCWTSAGAVSYHRSICCRVAAQKKPFLGPSSFSGSSHDSADCRNEGQKRVRRDGKETDSAASQQEPFSQDQLKVSFVPQC